MVVCIYLGLMRIVGCGILGKGRSFPKNRNYSHVSSFVKFSTYAMAYVHGKSSSSLVRPGPRHFGWVLIALAS